MKNHKLTILLVLVAAIWGTIGYKIFTSMTDEPSGYRARPRHILTDSLGADQYKLSLNYRDPFLKRAQTPAQTATVKKIAPGIKTTPVPMPVLIEWSQIQYFGVMYNASKKIPTATIKIGANEYIAKEGSRVEGFLISEVLNDSVKLVYQGQSKFIKKAKQ